MSEMMKAMNMPMKGARKMNAAIFSITAPWMAANPFAMMAEPAKPPISVWDDEEGIPFHQVSRFQMPAPTTPARIIGSVMYCSYTVLDTVLAMPKSPLIYLEIKNATKLKEAAQSTA